MPSTRRLLAAALVAREADTQAHAEGNGKDDETDDEEAPPLELAGAPGVVAGPLDLFVALLDVFDGLLGVVLGGLDGRLLRLHRLGQPDVELGELGERVLNLRELIVAGPDVAKKGARVGGAVRAQLSRTLVHCSADDLCR